MGNAKMLAEAQPKYYRTALKYNAVKSLHEAVVQARSDNYNAATLEKIENLVQAAPNLASKAAQGKAEHPDYFIKTSKTGLESATQYLPITVI